VNVNVVAEMTKFCSSPSLKIKDKDFFCKQFMLPKQTSTKYMHLTFI